MVPGVPLQSLRSYRLVKTKFKLILRVHDAVRRRSHRLIEKGRTTFGAEPIETRKPNQELCAILGDAA